MRSCRLYRYLCDVHLSFLIGMEGDQKWTHLWNFHSSESTMNLSFDPLLQCTLMCPEYKSANTISNNFVYHIHVAWECKLYPHYWELFQQLFRDLDISSYLSIANQNGKYNLIAVICHKGTTDGGHCEFYYLHVRILCHALQIPGRSQSGGELINIHGEY